MCSLHYGFVWISEPMVLTLFVQLCLNNCVISALYGIYSDQQYKNDDDTIIMIM